MTQYLREGSKRGTLGSPLHEYETTFGTQKLMVVEQDRMIHLTSNAKSIQKHFPKEHPYTKRRIYAKGYYWSWTDGQLTAIYDSFFDNIDNEYVETMENGYLVYHISYGWTPKGYCWVSNEIGEVTYSSIEYQQEEDKCRESCKRQKCS